MSTDLWPLFGLRVTTPRLALRPLRDTDFDEMCALIADGIHPPGVMPFTFPWTQLEPPELQRQAMQYHWRQRAGWKADDWTLDFGVWEAGRLVGQQGIMAKDFPTLREVMSGSWVGMPHQSRGIGKEMRAAVLHLAFETLGARRARTEAFADNPASLAVTRSLGYEPNGDEYQVRKDRPAHFLRFVLERAAWAEHRRDDVTVEGFEPCRDMFGLAEDAT
jgi:RimJ/RimL family protein N-acetyltransferase